MTRKQTKHSLPYALVSSTLGTSLVCIFAAWLSASSLYLPTDATTDRSPSASSGRLYQLSPIPPGADWTS